MFDRPTQQKKYQQRTSIKHKKNLKIQKNIVSFEIEIQKKKRENLFYEL